jgi:hypothetical protein
MNILDLLENELTEAVLTPDEELELRGHMDTLKRIIQNGENVPDDLKKLVTDFFGSEPEAAAAAGSSTPSAGSRRPRTLAPPDPKVMDAQRMLKALGADLGTFGPNKDGIDGRIGNKTRTAASLYQQGKLPGQSSGTTPASTSTTTTSSTGSTTSSTTGTTVSSTTPTRGPNGEPLVKNDKGQTGYMKIQGRSRVFVPLSEDQDLVNLVKLLEKLK